MTQLEPFKYAIVDMKESKQINLYNMCVYKNWAIKVTKMRVMKDLTIKPLKNMYKRNEK